MGPVGSPVPMPMGVGGTDSATSGGPGTLLSAKLYEINNCWDILENIENVI